MEKIYVYEGRAYKENQIDELMRICNAWDFENFAEFLIGQCEIELSDILAKFEEGTLSDFLNEYRKKYISYFKEDDYWSYEVDAYELAE